MTDERATAGEDKSLLDGTKGGSMYAAGTI